MGNFKLTGLGAPTTAGDALSFGANQGPFQSTSAAPGFAVYITKTDSGTPNQIGPNLTLGNIQAANVSRVGDIYAGRIVWQFSQPTSGVVQESAFIAALSDGAQVGTSTQSYLSFGTTIAGAFSAAERMRIDSTGNVLPATTNIYALGSTTMRWSTVFGVLGNFSGLVTASAGVSTTTVAASGLSTNSVGINVGNSLQAAATTLDWYEEGTFTPALQFGGANVGMTPAGSGFFTRVGNVVHFWILGCGYGAKGSSTGAASISGLPYTVNSAANSPALFTVTQLASALSGNPIAYARFSSTSVDLYDNSPAGANTALTDVKFSSGTSPGINISGSYRV